MMQYAIDSNELYLILLCCVHVITFLGRTHLCYFIQNLMDWRCVWTHAALAMKRASSVVPAPLILK